MKRTSSSENQVEENTNSEEEDEEMKQLHKECYEALLQIVKDLAAAKDIKYTNIMNMIALRYVH